MEGVAAATSINGLITAIGLPSTIILLGVIAFFIIREVKKECEATRESMDGLKKDTLSMFDELKQYADGKDAALTEELQQLKKEVKYIQHDYITKADHYQDTEGWNTEIQRLRAEVSKLPLEIIKLIQNQKG